MPAAACPVAFVLFALALLGGCAPAASEPPSPVVVFMLDAPADPDFVEGRPVSVRALQVSHGSLVGRVLRSYCRAPIIAIPVELPGAGLDKAAYIEGLRAALDHVRKNPSHRVLVNISLSADLPDPEEERLVAELFSEGALVVAAAGNDGSDRPVYPAAYAGAIAVASATPKGKDPASNYGRHILLSASGDITFIDYQFLPYEWLRRQTEARGTSFAAPRVTATLAALMEADPRLTPLQVLAIVCGTARPIADERFRAGLLGAGCLDIYRAKAAVLPAYRLVHHVLPIALFALAGAATAYLVASWGLAGASLSLLLWLVVLPVSVYAAIWLKEYLEFVGGGSLAIGLIVAPLLVSATAASAAIQDWNVPKTAACAALYAAGLAAMRAAGLSGPRASAVAPLAAACLSVGAAAVLEHRARRLIARLQAVQSGAESGWSSRQLAAVRRRAWDKRIQREALAALGRLGDEEAVRALLAERRLRPDATKALAAVAARNLSALEGPLSRFAELDRAAQELLLDALEQADNPQAAPLLEKVAIAAGSEQAQRVARFLSRADRT